MKEITPILSLRGHFSRSLRTTTRALVDTRAVTRFPSALLPCLVSLKNRVYNKHSDHHSPARWKLQEDTWSTPALMNTQITKDLKKKCYFLTFQMCILGLLRTLVMIVLGFWNYLKTQDTKPVLSQITEQRLYSLLSFNHLMFSNKSIPKYETEQNWPF